MSNLEQITKQMQILEITIQREQIYISKHGASNDTGDQDTQWEQYKEGADQNLAKWDKLKSMRDNLKK